MDEYFVAKVGIDEVELGFVWVVFVVAGDIDCVIAHICRAAIGEVGTIKGVGSVFVAVLVGVAVSVHARTLHHELPAQGEGTVGVHPWPATNDDVELEFVVVGSVNVAAQFHVQIRVNGSGSLETAEGVVEVHGCGDAVDFLGLEPAKVPHDATQSEDGIIDEVSAVIVGSVIVGVVEFEELVELDMVDQAGGGRYDRTPEHEVGYGTTSADTNVHGGRGEGHLFVSDLVLVKDALGGLGSCQRERGEHQDAEGDGDNGQR